MSNNKRPSLPGTRDAVETAIDLSKYDKNASWDELAALNRRQRFADSVEAVVRPPPPTQVSRVGK